MTGRYNGYGEYVLHCPHEALNLSTGRVQWQSDACRQCDTCLYMYPQQATPMAQGMSVDEVLQHIRKASLFIEGITVSDGEATTQPPLIVALFIVTKTDPQLQHLTCVTDGNGILSEAGWQKLLPVYGGAMPDLKAWDSTCHQQFTGRDDTLVK